MTPAGNSRACAAPVRSRATSHSSARTSGEPAPRSWIAIRSFLVSAGLNQLHELLFIHTVYQARSMHLA